MFIDDSVQKMLLAFHSTIKHEQYRIMNDVYVNACTFLKFSFFQKNLPDTIYT